MWPGKVCSPFQEAPASCTSPQVPLAPAQLLPGSLGSCSRCRFFCPCCNLGRGKVTGRGFLLEEEIPPGCWGWQHLREAPPGAFCFWEVPWLSVTLLVTHRAVEGQQLLSHCRAERSPWHIMAFYSRNEIGKWHLGGLGEFAAHPAPPLPGLGTLLTIPACSKP